MSKKWLDFEWSLNYLNLHDMAATRVNEVGKSFVSNTVPILNLVSIRRDANIGLSVCYDGKWLNDFIENVVKGSGKWTSPEGQSRKFNSLGSDLVMTWYYGKQKTLLFHGKAGLELKEALIQFCAEKSFSCDNADPCLAKDQKDPLDASCNLSFAESEKSVDGENVGNSIDLFQEYGKANSSNSLADHVGCNCACFCSAASVDFDDIKLNMEILQSRVDAA